MSTLFYKARSSSDELVLLVDEGEALLNSLHSSVSICACKNRSFGSGINGTVINALNKPTTILKFNGDVTKTSNLKIEGYVVANPTSANTYEFFQFLEESKSRIEAKKKLALVIQPSDGNYNDFTVYKQISSIKFKLGFKVYDLCTVSKSNTIKFPPNIFETIQIAFEKDYCLFYTLLALITKILNSNMIYLKYSCVTSPSSMRDLSYNEATEKYSEYQAAKASDNKAPTSDFFLYKKVGRLYETQLCFNENSSLFRAENIADSIILLSGTWNEWLLNLMYSNKPFIFQENLILNDNDRIENSKFKSDLFLLRFLLLKYRSKIPSIKMNEKIIFCSFNSNVSIKKDDSVLNQPKNKEKYYDRIKEVASDNLLDEIFKHLQPSVENSITNDIPSSSIRKSIKLTFKSLEKLLNEITSDYKLSRKDFSITWKDNASYALSSSSQTGLLKKLSALKKKYEKSNETDSQLTFKDFILKEWLSKNKNESSLFGAGGKRPRKPRLGISVERTVYNSKTINRLKSTLTSSEQKIYKKRMQKILKKLRLN